jgi:hypothetical protein
MFCRDCDRVAKWVFTNMPMSHHPFCCGIHKRKYSAMEIHMMGYSDNDNQRKPKCRQGELRRNEKKP